MAGDANSLEKTQLRQRITNLLWNTRFCSECYFAAVDTVSVVNHNFTAEHAIRQRMCCDVVVAQINYPSFKHNTQDSIEQARGQSHEEDSSQIFMLDEMQFGGVWTLSRLKQKKTENYRTKFNKIKKLSREQTLVANKHPPSEIRTDHGNKTSIYILNIYLFLTLVS